MICNRDCDILPQCPWQFPQQRQRVPCRSYPRQPISDHYRHIAGVLGCPTSGPVLARCGIQKLPQPHPASLIERPPQIGPQQILHPVPRLARHQYGFPKSRVPQLPRQCLRVEPGAHRIPSPRVRQFKVQQGPCRNAPAHATQPNPRWRKSPQLQPHIGRLYLSHSLAPGSSLRSAPTSNKSPRLLQIPIRSSHASNSGARPSPSTLRAYSAS